MFRVGLDVSVEIEVECWVSSGDDIVVHISVWGTDVAKGACFGLYWKRLGIHHAEVFDCMTKAVGALVVFIVPLFGGSVASFASDTFGGFGDWEVGG